MNRFLWLGALLSISCGSAVIESATPSQTAGSSPSSTVQPAPTRSAAAPATETASAAALRFPVAAEVELAPGRYSSQPPFDIEFTFDVPDGGWESGHLHGEFFDPLQLESPGTPSRWIAFAHPDIIHGQTDASATGLTPQEALDKVASLDGLETSPSEPFAIGGLSGVVADLKATGQQVSLFGGENGDFGFNSDLDMRLGVVSFEDALLLVLVLAPADDLEDAWSEAAPILESVAFAAP